MLGPLVPTRLRAARLLLLLVVVVVATTAKAAAEEGGAAKPPVYVRFDFSGLVEGAAEASAVFEVRPDWAPIGAARFLELVEGGFFSDIRFFRVVNKFVAQFGISGDPAVSAKWRSRALKDDPVTQPNRRGTISFATSGANTRTTQLFINLVDNAFLDKMGFAPIGRFVDAGAPMSGVVDRIYKGAGERPQQGLAQSQGNAYLGRDFPKLSAIASATIVADPAEAGTSKQTNAAGHHHDGDDADEKPAAHHHHHHGEVKGGAAAHHGDHDETHHGHDHSKHHHHERQHHNARDHNDHDGGATADGGGGTSTGHHAGPGLLVLAMGGLGAAGALLILLRRRSAGRHPSRPLLPRSA